MGNRTRRTAGRVGDGDRRRGQGGRAKASAGEASGRRNGQARHGGRSVGGGSERSAARRRSGTGSRRIGWGGGLGLVGGLVLAGAAIVFAGQALQKGGDPGTPASPLAATIGAGVGSPSPAASPARPGSLPEAPLLHEPARTTADRAITISGRLHKELPAGGGPYRLRIYVNDALRRDVRLGRHELEFRVRNVPLQRGANSIRAAVAGEFGESPHSAAVLVERDDEPPELSLAEPADGAVVYQQAATLRGTTEPGALISATTAAGGSGGSVLAAADGVFSIPLLLEVGLNSIVVSSRDAAGNTARLQLAVERRESEAGATIELSREAFDIDRLPATITITARLTGVDGQPVDGAEVIFSLSAPGQMTTTYSAPATAGVASWTSVLLPREGAVAGRGLVTVMATLADGQELRNSASFTFR